MCLRLGAYDKCDSFYDFVIALAQLALSTVLYLSTSSLTDPNVFVIAHPLPLLASVRVCLGPHIMWPSWKME